MEVLFLSRPCFLSSCSSCLVALLFSSFVCEKEKEEKRGKKREKGGGAEIEKERKAWKALKVC